MKHRLTQTFPLLLAAALQLLPLMRNIVTSPVAGSSFAFILRWGIGSAAALESVNAVSGATNGFAGGTNLTLTANAPFTTNVLLSAKTQGDGGAFCIITNLVTMSLTTLQSNQSTTNAMPVGLTFKFIDINSGNLNFTNVYCQIYGTPTQVGINAFNIGLFHPSATEISGFFKIAVVAGAGSPPTITNQPVAGTTNLVGTTNTSFSVTAGGLPAPAYQWYFNANTALLNQTNAALTLNNIQMTNAGYYRCTITNSAGSTNSANAFLTVWQPPVITNQPVGTAIVAGGAVTINIVAGGTPTLNYQWKFNTNTVLTGATGTTLSLANLRANQAGIYSVTVTNAAGVTNSFFATLTVTNPPPPVLASTVNVSSGKFNFTFTPVPGLTNTVLTNGTLVGGNWGVFTNVPPPASATPITLASPAGGGNLFYKLMIQP